MTESDAAGDGSEPRDPELPVRIAALIRAAMRKDIHAVEQLIGELRDRGDDWVVPWLGSHRLRLDSPTEAPEP